ncbi:MAG: hypothetical protein GC190_01000 [Alphaproteobacteria bacterium]|nr:hypothetical protein [Alphaproteobacteria bacterium]
MATKSGSSPFITILGTDVEGSSDRRHRHGDEAMDAALAKHNSILTDVVTEFGGEIFKNTGDGVYVAFVNPVDAARAAITAQQRIAGTNWTSVGGLSVRMAIHFGSAKKTAGDYLGKGVNRAGKLLPLGHGGQILVTAETKGLVRAEDHSIEFKKVGAEILDDNSQVVEIFQVVSKGLQPDFPPLRGTRQEISSAPVHTSDGRTYRLKKQFTAGEREKFRRAAFRELRSQFREMIDALAVVDGISASFEEMGANAFTCSIINEAHKSGTAHITVRTSGESFLVGDLSYVWSAHADANTSNGWFSIDEDDYDLFLRGGMGSDRRDRLSPHEAAEVLWEQFIKQAEISYERPKEV